MKLHELQEKRSQAVAAMRALADTVETRGDDYTADEEKRHADLKKEIADLDAKITRAKDIADAERAAPAVISGNGRDGAYEERAREFSITRAINAALGEPVDAGFEREISTEVRNRAGRPFMGIAVPDEAFLERRTLTTGGDAASLYPTAHRPDLFIDRLRSALVVGRLGATVLDGLIGPQEIPRQIASSTAQHVTEDSALTETDADFDDVSLAPKTVGAMTSFSRRTLINASPSIEQLVRRDLAAVIANAIDLQALMGAGTGGAPTGILNTAGIATPTLAGPTWVQVLDVIASIAAEDADLASLGWAMNPNAVAKLRGTPKLASTDSVMLMQEPGNLAGYPVASTTAIPDLGGPPATDHYVFFGAWSQLLVGYWSGTDVLVNPYGDTAFARGRVQVRAMRDYDVAVRHAESFAVANDMPV